MKSIKTIKGSVVHLLSVMIGVLVENGIRVALEGELAYMKTWIDPCQIGQDTKDGLSCWGLELELLMHLEGKHVKTMAASLSRVQDTLDAFMDLNKLPLIKTLTSKTVCNCAARFCAKAQGKLLMDQKQALDERIGDVYLVFAKILTRLLKELTLADDEGKIKQKNLQMLCLLMDELKTDYQTFRKHGKI